MSDNDTKTPWGDLARLEGNNFSLLSESRNGDFWERVATVGVGSFPGTLSYGQRNALELEHYNALLAKGRKSGLTRLLRLQELCAPESIIKHTRSGLSKYYTKAYKVHCRDKARHLSGWYKHDLRRRLYNVGNWIKAWGQDTMDRELQEIEAIRKYVATLRELGLGEHDGPEPGSITDPYGDSEEPVSIYWALERIEDYATEEKLAEYKAHITFGEGLLFLVSVSRPEGNDPGDDWLVLENLRSAVPCQVGDFESSVFLRDLDRGL